MDISVVIPVYGCRAAIRELYMRLSNTLKILTDDYEIILVNDSCPQNSWEAIVKICEDDKKVKGIELSRNFGQIKAITAGLDNCSGDWAVVMDCDLQDAPEDIINLYNKAQEGYDVVFAHRTNRKSSFLKLAVSRLFYKIYSFATDGFYDTEISNFSICKKEVIKNYCSMREQHRAYAIYIKWLGFRQTSIEITQCPRKEGKSSYDIKRKTKLAIDILTSQSDKLMRLTAKIGFFMILISFLGIITAVINYFVNHILAGWTSTIIIFILIGGIITMSLGITGIYIGNIFMQTKERPLYVIRSYLNK